MMKDSVLCVFSMLGGMILGSAVALALTPKTGREWRDSIRELIDKEVDKMRCHCNDEAHAK